MPVTPRHKRFQIHLSTAIVLMFTAGALMWLNTRPHQWKVVLDNTLYYNDSFSTCGWPFSSAVTLFQDYRVMRNAPKAIFSVGFFSLAFDLAVAILILSIVYFACEWLIRRRTISKAE